MKTADGYDVTVERWKLWNRVPMFKVRFRFVQRLAKGRAQWDLTLNDSELVRWAEQEAEENMAKWPVGFALAKLAQAAEIGGGENSMTQGKGLGA